MLRKISRIKKRTVLAVAAAACVIAGHTSNATAAEIDFGEIGDPVNLVTLRKVFA